MAISVVVQGWRGISHSYAMVNQYQLLELARRQDIALFHEDLPYFRPEWSPAVSDSGFDDERRRRLAQIASGVGIKADITYRISYPLRFYGGESRRIFSFGTAEHQSLGPNMIYQGPECSHPHANEMVEIVTPSHWSKEGFVRHGFSPSRVHVVPHGVDPTIFRLPNAAERAEARQALGLAEGQFVFLSVGAMTQNKGIDLLIRAFEAVHRRHPSSVLLLKDARALFSIAADKVIAETFAHHSLDPAARRAIGVLSRNFALEDMRALYGAADAYVSPYRAEGFGLTPLEAAACGLPVLVTEGGATDDYVQPAFARPIASRRQRNAEGDWLEPDLDSLIAGMEEMAERRTGCDAAIAVPWIAENYSWAKAVEKLAALFCS